MKAYSFLLNFGYAEDGGLGFVPFVSKQKFASVKAALVDLANFFRDALAEKEGETENRVCCGSTLAIEPSAKYCIKCARSLSAKMFDVDEYIDFVRMIGESDCNSYYSNIVAYDDQARWQSELPKDLSDVKIIYVAEKTLAAALGDEYSPNDQVTLDSIFKKRKGNSYSFWGF
jgi:hypothetical protein